VLSSRINVLADGLMFTTGRFSADLHWPVLGVHRGPRLLIDPSLSLLWCVPCLCCQAAISMRRVSRLASVEFACLARL
jgi:hypothetical protein